MRESYQQRWKKISINIQKSKKLGNKNNLTNEDCSEGEDEFETEAAQLCEQLPVTETFLLNEYVAVAYQNTWYPGCVENTPNNETAVVNFMSPCRMPGHFKWPQRQDKQTLKKEFVLKRRFIPECINSGRQWYFKEFKEIDGVFSKNKEVFFYI